ncbi:MAG: alpha/beta hydrolase [Bacteroidota bacterium]
MENKILAYTDQGEGLVVVLVHGFCETKAIWSDFAAKLAEKYRVISIELPGFGENEPLTTPVTIGDLSEPIYRLLQSLGIEQSVMIGHSMGGYVTLAFAEKFPMRLCGLGLFHSTAYADTMEKKHARSKTIEFIERYGVVEFVEEFVTPLFFEGRKKDLKDEIKFATDMGKATPKSTVIEAIKAMRDRKDRSKVLEKASYPVLFISGRNDSAISFTTASPQFMLAADTTIHVMNSTGHMGMLEYPADTLRMVRQFLEHVEAGL